MKDHIIMVNWDKKDITSSKSEKVLKKLLSEGYEIFGKNSGFNVTNISKINYYDYRTIRETIEHSV